MKKRAEKQRRSAASAGGSIGSDLTQTSRVSHVLLRRRSSSRKRRVLVLGGGVTGLAAGYISGVDVYEAAERPGGICCSYYVRPGARERLASAPKDGEAYRFEVGGGHWIFGGDPLVLDFIRAIAPIKYYVRQSAVYLPDWERFVPYPIQNNLRFLDRQIASQILQEIVMRRSVPSEWRTLSDWLRASFGPTLCELFFEPFHELYTAGLFRAVAPQDAYKSPVDVSLVVGGAFDEVAEVGYNRTFVYPVEGLNVLTERMAARCRVQYGKRVVRIDAEAREVYFDDGTYEGYEELISSLPLSKVMEMAGLDVGERAGPATAVLVVNVGAVRGPKCPSVHWVYVPRSRAGFHRVGFYSNVDVSFLPASVRQRGSHVSIYVEKAYREGTRPSNSEIARVCSEALGELQEWGWIAEAEVVDASWIDVAYTWSWAGSKWREKALKVLEERGIFQVGRYGRWAFQGIAESVRDGLIAGSVVRGKARLGVRAPSGSRDARRLSVEGPARGRRV